MPSGERVGFQPELARESDGLETGFRPPVRFLTGAIFQPCDLGQQLIPQDRRGLTRQDGRPVAVGALAGPLERFCRRGRQPTIRTGRRCGRAGLRAWLDRLNGEVGRIEIVLAGDSDQGEQGIAPGIGEGRAHPMGSGRLRGRADRPVRRHPFAGGVHERGRQSDQAAVPVDRGALDGRDLMLAQAFADDVEARGEGSIAKGPLALARERRLDGGGQRLFRIGDLGLRLGECRRQRADLMAGSLHDAAPLSRCQN